MTNQDPYLLQPSGTRSTGHAIEVIANPQRFCNAPHLLQDAWAQLKEERGQPVDFRRIGPAAYLIAPQADPAPAPHEPAPVHVGMSAEALDRVRRRANVLRWLNSMTGGGSAA